MWWTKRLLTFSLPIVLLTQFLTIGRAQEQSEPDPSQMSREQWREQIKISRERSEVIRRDRRHLKPQPPTPEELAAEASRRALEDDSLRPGDLVSINKGLFRYQGKQDRERSPEDFVRIR